MSFSSLVERLILKKTSLLLSVTLMFRCSAAAGASLRSALGEPFSWLSDIATGIVGVRGVGHDPVAGRRGGGGFAGGAKGVVGFVGSADAIAVAGVGELRIRLLARVALGEVRVVVAKEVVLAGAEEENDDGDGEKKIEERVEEEVASKRRAGRRLRHGVSQYLFLVWVQWLGAWCEVDEDDKVEDQVAKTDQGRRKSWLTFELVESWCCVW